MTRATFVFRHAKGVLAVSAECPGNRSLVDLYQEMKASAEEQVGGSVFLIRSGVSAMRPVRTGIVARLSSTPTKVFQQ